MKNCFKFIILIIIMFSVNVIIFSDFKGIFLYRNANPSEVSAIKNLGDFYLDIEDFKDKNFVINKSNNVLFVIHNQKVLEISLTQKYTKINFINRYDNTVLILDNKIYIHQKVIEEFLGYKSHKELENIFFFTQMPQVRNINYSTQKITIEMDTFFNEKSVSLNEINNSKIIRIFPSAEARAIPGSVNYTYSGNNIYLRFDSDFSYEIEIVENIVYIHIKEDVMEKEEEKPSKAGFEFLEKSFIINNEEIKVYIAKTDPKIYDIVVDTNNLGKRSEFLPFLEEKQPILSINASFFNTSTLEPIGTIIKDGQVVHLTSYSRPVFYLNNENKPDITYLKMEYQVEIEGLLFWIKAVNSEWRGDVSLYTSHYTGNITETEEEYIFYLIENNVIIDIGKKAPKENQKLLLISKNYERHLSNIIIGSYTDFKKDIDLSLNSDIKELVEGGPILVNTSFSDEMMSEERRSYNEGIITGRTSRTFLAIDNEDNITFFVTEGNSDKTLGVNYYGALEILKQHGNYKKAILFDGGGSSVFYYNGKLYNDDNKNLRVNIPVFISVYEKE